MTTDMIELCNRIGIPVPCPTTDARSRLVYKTAVRSMDEIYAVLRYLVDGGCKPSIKTCYYNRSTVEVVENRRAECWIFKFYARNAEHAETIAGELLCIAEPHREYQMELGI